MHRIHQILTAALGLVLLAGCGKKSDLVKIGGVLQFDDGSPISQATVKFIPEAEDGKAANGYSGNDGNFEITTFNSGDGIAPGKYKVVVTKFDPKDVAGAGSVAQGPPQDADMTKLMKEAWTKRGQPTGRPTEPVSI